MAKHAFLSFVVEDKTSADLFRGQAKNKNSDLSFDDHFVTNPYNSGVFVSQVAEVAREPGVRQQL